MLLQKDRDGGSRGLALKDFHFCRSQRLDVGGTLGYGGSDTQNAFQ